MKENKQEQFNNPRVVVDLEKHKQDKIEGEKKEEIEMLREKLCLIKRETEKNLRSKDYKGYFLKGPEILDVDTKELTERDLLLYKELQDFKNGKVDSDKVCSVFQNHKKAMAKHTIERAQKDPNFNFQKDSRIAFFGWLGNRMLAELGRRKKVEKEKEIEKK